jgi:hypothetical protein
VHPRCCDVGVLEGEGANLLARLSLNTLVALKRISACLAGGQQGSQDRERQRLSHSREPAASGGRRCVSQIGHRVIVTPTGTAWIVQEERPTDRGVRGAYGRVLGA